MSFRRVGMIQTRMDTFFWENSRCQDLVVRFLFHGTMELENSQFKVYIWFFKILEEGYLGCFFRYVLAGTLVVQLLFGFTKRPQQLITMFFDRSSLNKSTLEVQHSLTTRRFGRWWHTFWKFDFCFRFQVYFLASTTPQEWSLTCTCRYCIPIYCLSCCFFSPVTADVAGMWSLTCLVGQWKAGRYDLLDSW